jgi:hypothetical protein
VLLIIQADQGWPPLYLASLVALQSLFKCAPSDTNATPRVSP